MEISQNIMINNTYIDKFNIQSILNDDELIKTIILLKYNMNSSTLIEIIANIFDIKYINQNQLFLMIDINKIKNVNCFIKDFDELDFNDKQTIMNNLNLIDGEFKDKIYEINNNKQYMTLEYILNR